MEQRYGIVGRYYLKPARKRLEILFDEYSVFPQKLKAYESNLQMMISAEREFSRNAARGDLGVRIQTNTISSVTEQRAIEDIMIEEFIGSEGADEDFLKDVEDFEEIMLGIRELKLMKMEYETLRKNIGLISDRDKEFYLPYLYKKKDVLDLCEEYGLSLDGMKSKLRRVRKGIALGMEGFMREYNEDMTISGGKRNGDHK